MLLLVAPLTTDHPLGNAGAVTPSKFCVYGKVVTVGSAWVVKEITVQPVASPLSL
jgi:hypothetical protein